MSHGVRAQKETPLPQPPDADILRWSEGREKLRNITDFRHDQGSIEVWLSTFVTERRKVTRSGMFHVLELTPTIRHASRDMNIFHVKELLVTSCFLDPVRENDACQCSGRDSTHRRCSQQWTTHLQWPYLLPPMAKIIRPAVTMLNEGYRSAG